MMDFSNKQKEELENNDELFNDIEKAINYEEEVKERVELYKLQERLDKKYTTTLGKIDSVLEYIQTSSSDLTLPEGAEPRTDAAETLLEVEQEVRQLQHAAEKVYKYYADRKAAGMKISCYEEIGKIINKNRVEKIVKYQSREYCKDIGCLAYQNPKLFGVDEDTLSDYCNYINECEAYKFHKWLQDNNYKIVKENE